MTDDNAGQLRQVWQTHGARALAADAHLDPLATPERVSVCGDWHGSLGALRWSLRAAAHAGSSTVVHTGDFGIWPGPSGQRFLDEVERALAHYDLTLLFVDGNHEDFDQLHTYPLAARHGLRCVRPRLYHLPRGTRWSWAGLTWLAVGGATSLDRPARIGGVSWWAQEELTWREALAAIEGGPADIMVTHDCPAGVTIPGLPPATSWHPAELRRANQHRELLGEVVHHVRPTHLFHGHFHSRYTSDIDLGAGLVCQVDGLDRDGTMDRSITHWAVRDLVADSQQRRAAQDAPGTDAVGQGSPGDG